MTVWDGIGGVDIDEASEEGRWWWVVMMVVVVVCLAIFVSMNLIIQAASPVLHHQ